MKIKDIVEFNKENYFNGAIQTEWFYDPTRVEKIATSYVFHGPRYYGVSSKDLARTSHTLIDTATFTRKIAYKLTNDKSEGENNFIMTIAGYGTGKSHLAVCLGALFGGTRELSSKVIDNLALADEGIAQDVRNRQVKLNLIIALNGMNNFNLDAEVLKCARLSLKMNGINEDCLRQITKAYDIARHFVERNYVVYEDLFSEVARKHEIKVPAKQLKEYLINHVEDNSFVIETINDVYKHVNGDAIQWERGIAAGDILTVLQKELCGENKPFNKVLILFDEFGRFIEYAAANPMVAGEAALQQIFESVQDADGKIIFTGFIQNDLSAYLSRIEKTANIVRYVGRYENSEKLFLSSNFETILANLLYKNETAGFAKTVEGAFSRYENFHKRIFDSLGRWDKSIQKKSVWTSFSMYRNTILIGCYPLHPITTWLLSNTSEWMQQRSTIAFVAEMYDLIKDETIEGTWLPYIYPIDLVDSNIYNEMLNSEEKGLVQSQFCMLYRDIILKIGNKLTDTELKVLKAILILNVGKFVLYNRKDAITAIKYCSNVKEEDIGAAVKSLENMHGVIAFDESAKTYDLIAEASGFNEFKRIFAKYRVGTVASIDDIDSNLLNEAQLSGIVETSFAQEHNISSTEWVFKKLLLDVSDFTTGYAISLRNELNNNYSGEDPRGILIYAYCNANRAAEVVRISQIINETSLASFPIIIILLDDSEGDITTALTVKNAIAKFSRADYERFQKHISGQVRAQNKKIIQAVSKLMAERLLITGAGITKYEGRLNALCSARFNELYTKTLAFLFDGFQNKITTQAKKYLSNICIKLYDKTLMNIQSYQALTQDEKNRIKACLSVGVKTSWEVFGQDCILTLPQNTLVRDIYDAVEGKISVEQPQSIMSLMGEFTRPPYGLNLNALALFTFYYIAYHDKALFCYYGKEKLTAAHISDKIFKGSKLQPNEFKKIGLQINENAAIDPLVELCKTAIKSRNIEEYPALRAKLEQLVKQEGITEANQSLVASTITRLDEGDRIRKAILENNGKANELIRAAQVKLVPSKFIKVFDYITDFSIPLSDEYDFICGESVRSQVEKIKTDSDQILKQKYLRAIANLTCEITHLSQIKGIYKKVCDALRNNGYELYAEETEKRLATLEDELIAKQKYESALGDLEKDLAFSVDVSNITYEEACELRRKMQRWKNFLSAAQDIPTSIIRPFQDRLDSLILQIDERVKGLKQELNDALDQKNKASSIEDLILVEKELLVHLHMGFEQITVNKIESALSDIARIRAFVENLPDNLDELLSIQNGFTDDIDIVSKNEVNKKVQKLRTLEERWISQYVYDSAVIADLSANECVEWLDSTEKAPSYLSNESRSRIIKVKELIEDRLHKCKVDGVVSMFNSLSDLEKKQCLEILLQNK